MITAPTQTGADFSIVYYPDTQEYITDPPTLFNTMTQWTVDNKYKYKINMAAFMGDIVLTSDVASWEIADVALNILRNDGIDIFAVPGNHDYETVATRTTTLYNTRFGVGNYTKVTGYYDNEYGDNYYALLTMGGTDVLLLALEFGARSVVIDWAKTIMEANTTAYTIVVTHAFMYDDATRISVGDDYNPKTLGADSDGDDLWTGLIKLYTNIRQVWSGHETGFNWRMDYGDGGNKVFQFLNAHGSVDTHMVIAEYYLSSEIVKVTRFLASTGAVTHEVIIAL